MKVVVLSLQVREAGTLDKALRQEVHLVAVQDKALQGLHLANLVRQVGDLVVGEVQVLERCHQLDLGPDGEQLVGAHVEDEDGV